MAEQGSQERLGLHPATQQMLGVDQIRHLGYSPGAGAEKDKASKRTRAGDSTQCFHSFCQPHLTSPSSSPCVSFLMGHSFHQPLVLPLQQILPGLSPSVVLWPCSDTTPGGRRSHCCGTHSIILTTTGSLSLPQDRLQLGHQGHARPLCASTEGSASTATTPGEPQSHSTCFM